MQAFPSSQAAPSGLAEFEHVPVAVMQLATWHESSAVQVTGMPPQVPFEQTSPVVQRLPSLQLDPFALMGFEQTPPLHVPAAWHWSSAVQVIGVPAQAPFVQTSPVVQALPSLHAVPFGWFGFGQTPPLQVPAAWHWSSAVQVMGVPPQVPFEQTSPVVQASPSLHAVPLATGRKSH